jgi:hypothetical protein
VNILNLQFLQVILFVAAGEMLVVAYVARAIRGKEEKEFIEAELARRRELKPLGEQRKLLQVPSFAEHMLFGANGTSRTMSRYTFAIRGIYVLVFDEAGKAWLGFLTAGLLDTLKEGEYVLRNYNIPLRGWNQSEPGNSVLLGEKEHRMAIHVYPRWFDETKLDAPEWEAWRDIQEQWGTEATARGHRLPVDEILSRAWLTAVAKKRRRFDRGIDGLYGASTSTEAARVRRADAGRHASGGTRPRATPPVLTAPPCADPA